MRYNLHRTRQHYVQLAAGLLALATASANAGNLLQNGSFEAPVLPGVGTFNQAPTGWQGGDFMVRGTPPSGFPFYPSPEDGNQYEAIHYGAEAPSTGVVPPLYQTFNVTTPGTYQLSWYDNSGSYENYTVSVMVTGNPWITFTGAGTSAWHYRSVTVTLAAGSNKITFSGGGPGASYFAYLDNVDLELVGGSGGSGGSGGPPGFTDIDPTDVVVVTNGIASLAWNSIGSTNITVTASPFNWTNTLPVNVFVLMGGGTVSAISLNGLALGSGFYNGSACLPLQPGQYIGITYSVAPTLYCKPF